VKPRTLWLREGGALSFEPPARDGDAQADAFLSDPASPVPSQPRPIVASFVDRELHDQGWATSLVADQRFVEGRPDVLTWESAPLAQEVVVAGSIAAHLFVSTTGTDADFVAKLIDVWPEPPPQGTARGAACGRSIGLEPPAPGASEEAAGRAGLLFQGADGATLALWAILGRGYEVAVKEAGGASERPVLVAAERAPAPGLPVALKLEVRGGSVEASAGAPGALEVVFRGRAPDSPRGRAAVACSEARCRFLSLSVSGRASPGP
jgi:hypothetical protein